MRKKLLLNYRPLYIQMAPHPDAHIFLQQLHEARITVRHLKMTEKGMTFEVSRAALPTIRRLRKKLRVKLRFRYAENDEILRIDGVAILGLIMLICIPFFASQWVWQIEVESEIPELRVSLEKTLQQELAMSTPFQRKSLPDDTMLRQVLLEKHRDLAWVHIKKSGGHVAFVPLKAPQQVELPNDNDKAMHLIARKSGVITHFDLESGERRVSLHTTVYEGDVLVSGVMGSEEEYVVIGAKGAVYADYWLECSFVVPRKVQLLGQQSRQYRFLVKGMHKDAFEAQYYEEVNLPSFLSPYVKIASEQITETYENTITEENANQIILPLLHEKILQSLPEKTLIKKENLLHLEFDDDTVKGKVLFLINENIAKPLPVDRGE